MILATSTVRKSVDEDMIGVLLIILDVSFMICSVSTIPLSLILLRKHLQDKDEKKKKLTKLTKVTPISSISQEENKEKETTTNENIKMWSLQQ